MIQFKTIVFMISKQKEKMERMKQTYVGILIFISLLFSACTTTPEHNNKAVPVEDRTVTNRTYQEATSDSREVAKAETTAESHHPDIESKDVGYGESVSEQSTSPVALVFLKDADKYTTEGDSDRAVASLERGLDIEPKNPRLWNRLAAERLKQKMWVKAITLAKKSNAFAAGNNQLLKANWQIIAVARSALGDKEGARKAKKMVWRFSREQT